MSVVGDILGGVADAVGGVVSAVGDVVSGVVDAVVSNPIVAIAAATFAGLPSFGSLAVGDAAAAAAAAETAVAVDTFAEIGAMSIPGTYGAMSTTAALAPGVSSLVPVVEGLSMGAGASAAFDLAANGASTGLSLSTAVDALKTGKQIVDTVQIVNQATQQKSIVPVNAPIPAGWAVDSRWTPKLDQSSFKYDPATGGLYMETPQGTPQSGATPQNIVPPNSGALSSNTVLLLAGLGLVLYFAKG